MWLNDLLCLGNGIRSKHPKKIVKENSLKAGAKHLTE